MRNRDALKEDLVRQTAIRLLVSEGFEGFSMNKLARACNISVATLYIYYRDKDDLIIRIATEELTGLHDTMLKDFDPSLPFEEGLRIQWRNRVDHMTARPLSAALLEQLRSSTYHEQVFRLLMQDFKESMSAFIKNAIKNKEIEAMPIEVFWSVAYGPLYTLLRFRREGKSMGGKSFTFSNKILWQTFDLVIKALKK